MAYGQQQGNRSNYSNSKPATGGTRSEGGNKKFQDNPDEVGIGYEKEMKSGGSYIAITLTKDVAAGTKISIFPNDKVKNRTEKTPTHKAKLSKTKAK